ncbi:MAG: SUMF1/EgtB/PvdO family nonheme iron enzyme [Alphaproteobacteria bacterium]|nr:SUMF1/EgtB/PvdO family nonheme iron enzyme [Alphaproteobacteria bacterium]
MVRGVDAPSAANQGRDITVAQTSGERKIALVIGNASYAEQPLRNPVNDARAMARALHSQGFEVIARENATKAQMEDAVASFGEKLGPGAVGLVYYSGHGMQVNGRNFLIPVDANITSEQTVALRTLDADRVLEQMTAAQTRVNVVILDACRNNPFENRFRGTGGGLAQMNAPSGTIIAYATAPGKVASDGSGTNGLYTQELLKAMATPGMKVEEVFKQVRVGVARYSNNAQTPWEASSLTGDFFFVPGNAGGTQVASLPPPPAPALVVPSLPSVGGFSVDDIERQEGAAAAKWSTWQAGMQAAFDKAAAFKGRPEAQAQVWDRFLAAYAQKNPYSNEDEALRAEAQQRKASSQQVALVTPTIPTAVSAGGGNKTAGTVFRDCPDCPEMVEVPAGSFTMGSPSLDGGRHDNEGLQHMVTIPRSFAVGKTAVTFAQWDACVTDGGCNGYRPEDRGWGRGDRPVINVNWNNAQAYIQWLNGKVRSVVQVSTGGGSGPYRLLSESEFEYAARAGTTTRYWWGDDIGHGNANCIECGSQWDNKQTAPVGSFRPNPFGLYDMHGNVYSWVEDCWNDSYSGAPTDGSAATAGDCSHRVLRGASWNDIPGNLRSAYRNWGPADYRNDFIGFRLGRTSF